MQTDHIMSYQWGSCYNPPPPTNPKNPDIDASPLKERNRCVWHLPCTH